jgi:hypothetical protein
VIEVKTPTPGQERWFGVLLLAVFVVIGTMLLWQVGSLRVARVLWGIGLGLALLYYAVRPLRRPLYYGWMRLVYPIGWVISHVALAIVYYGIMTPLGLVMRLFGRDKLERRLEPTVESY